MGHRAGDNTQVQALGEALGWPFEVKRFVYHKYERILNLPFMATLAGVVKSESSALAPPWPDLILTAGRRNEPIARWIKRQSGGRTKLVQMGRPWAALERWDLVVTTPQYRLPRVPTVLHNEAPLHRVTPERLAKAAAEWGGRVAHLPRPYVTVLAGGPSGPYPFDAAAGARLARQASELARRGGGSLLVTTSARTPAATIDALFRNVTVPGMLYRWRRDDPENPFFGFLALADAIVVTADSVSMMAESCATGRPVHLFDTGEGKTSMREPPAPPTTPDTIWRHLSPDYLQAWIYRQTMKLGPTRLTRDIRIVQQRLVASGRAVWLGEGEPSAEPPPLEDVPRAVARVRALFE
ncbi:MAG: nucleoside-diphosphate sugar epimerase [Proteobacteria bacterium]|nr:MAG: nucleoside-diphosphate sugar epimerase [Pseudomonadota bacterium]